MIDLILQSLNHFETELDIRDNRIQKEYLNLASFEGISYHRDLVSTIPKDILKKYLFDVIQHKINVFYAGMDLIKSDIISSPYEDRFLHRLEIHDLSKFTAIEIRGYIDRFHYNNSTTFNKAWLNHIKSNDHHPEHWYLVDRAGENINPQNMNVLAIYEMIADWMGAGKSYGNPFEDWVKTNWKTFKYAPVTEIFIEKTLKRLNAI